MTNQSRVMISHLSASAARYPTSEDGTLAPLPSHDLRFLFIAKPKVLVPAHTILFSPEDRGQTLFLLVRGRADLFRLSRDGKRLVTRQVTPGSVFGVMRILGQPNRGNFAEATEESVVQSATREQVLDSFRARPELALRLLNHLGNRLSEIEERLVAVAFSPIPMRLAHYLLTSINTSLDTVEGISHAEIADTIGASRQSVTSTLNSMKAQGFLQIRRRRIRIVDRSALERTISTGRDNLTPQA